MISHQCNPCASSASRKELSKYPLTPSTQHTLYFIPFLLAEYTASWWLMKMLFLFFYQHNSTHNCSSGAVADPLLLSIWTAIMFAQTILYHSIKSPFLILIVLLLYIVITVHLLQSHLGLLVSVCTTATFTYSSAKLHSLTQYYPGCHCCITHVVKNTCSFSSILHMLYCPAHYCLVYCWAVPNPITTNIIVWHQKKKIL